MLEIAQILKARLGAAAKKVPARELPNWMVGAAALFDPAVKQILPELGKRKNATSAKAKRVLGWNPRLARGRDRRNRREVCLRLGLLKGSHAA